MANYFTNESPSLATNNTGNYGIVRGSINPAQIEDGLIDRGASLGKLGSSMPSPLARLFLFSAALREVNSYEDANPGNGHIGILNKQTGKNESTPYHDLVGEMLDMLEFVFQYGDHPDFHVVKWDVNTDCTILENSPNQAHKHLASALRSAFVFGVLAEQPTIYLFQWKDTIIGGTSPISLVYTSANLWSDLPNGKFTGDAADVLFDNDFFPLHKRSKNFREYLYRLYYTDLQALPIDAPLAQLATYIQQSASNYDDELNKVVKVNPNAYQNVKDLTSQGANVKVAGVQLRVSDHTVVINSSTSGYIIEPTTKAYQHGETNTQRPLVLNKHGVGGLIYAKDRPWSEDTDIIPPALAPEITNRDLPGFVGVKYPYLTVDDFFEDKVIEVSYKLNKTKFFTGCKENLSILLPLKKVFFEYFSLVDLVDARGNYTDMLKVKHDEEHMKMHIDLTVPLVNGKSICLHKSYNLSDGSTEKINCYDAGYTFDFAIFPFYRLEPDKDKNVYNIMIGATVNGVSMNFYEQTEDGILDVKSEKRNRTSREFGRSPLSTDHVRVKGAFSFGELTIEGKQTSALIIPLFQKVNSDSARAENRFVFSIDFGTTNTHVACVMTQSGMPIGRPNVKPFSYNDNDAQMVLFNDKSGVAEFGTFTTAVKRELVPTMIGDNQPEKFPMRTATYQVAGSPTKLEMFFSTNIGFNYGEDISRSKDYKTNIKWDRFDTLSKDCMKAFFAQMLWMMKNKSVLNNGSDRFELMVTYPISMRRSDLENFKAAWDSAMKEVHCDVIIKYCTESVAPYYSYLAELQYGAPYANMDIGGGTTDFLYVNPKNLDNHVFSAFFAANDLWNDGIDKVNQANKNNGFIAYYKQKHLENLGNDKAQVQSVIENASSSADIVSYLFANDELTCFSESISPQMMQILVIHFSALAFYMAYSLHMAEVEIPKRISFTGMGSKYIKLISKSDKDLADIVTKVFQYAGEVLKNSKLKNASVDVIFADNPKEVTAIGALISLNYSKPIKPIVDTYYGYETEEPGKTMHYSDVTQDVCDGVRELFLKFTELFENQAFIDVLSDIGWNIEPRVKDKLQQNAGYSLQQMYDFSREGQSIQSIFNEPMFFWPLKNALYIIGKELANDGR